nr:hypothetical protein BaRGS_019460 [Batillaria attramentaria]
MGVVVRPRIHKRLVTSRIIRAISSSEFQFDVKATVAAVDVSQPPTLDLAHLVDAYNDGLRQVLDRHAPSVTRLCTDKGFKILQSFLTWGPLSAKICKCRGKTWTAVKTVGRGNGKHKDIGVWADN